MIQTSNRSCPIHDLNYENCGGDDPMEGTSKAETSSQFEGLNNQTVVENTNCDSDKKKIKVSSTDQKKCITDTHQYSQMIESTWFNVEGRRIVDWNYISKCLLEAQRTHSKICTGLLCMMNEKYRSMISVMVLQCDVCESQFKVRTEEPSGIPQLRRSTVWATLCSGGTYNSTKELLTLCNISFMPFNTFLMK